MFDERNLQRRVAGVHDIRLDGMLDIVLRAKGASVLDIGCNRGMVGFEMANNGAKLVHGCDNFEDGIWTARQVFADIRSVESQHEVIDLTKGPHAFDVFGDRTYDIVLCLAVMIRYLGRHTREYFAWRATTEKFQENQAEMEMMDRELGAEQLRRVHTSYLSKVLGVAAIWARGY
jgi:hypothetical protein